MDRFRKPIIGAFVGFIVFGMLALLTSSLYYKFMPGNWFVNYYYIKVDDSEIGKDVQFTSCRTLRGTNIKFDATRTFLMKGDNDNQFLPVGDYDFQASLETRKDSKCQPLRITPERQPQIPGTYKLVTEGTFKVNGVEKSIHYESNEYKITPNATSIQDQILELQRQIDKLKLDLSNVDPSNSLLTPTTAAPVAAAPAPQTPRLTVVQAQPQAVAEPPRNNPGNGSLPPTVPDVVPPPTTNPVVTVLQGIPILGRLFQ